MKHKVDVLTIRPGRVTTSMTGMVTDSNYSSAEQTAREAVNALGNKDIIYGPLVHRKLAVIIELAHDWFSRNVTKENAALKAKFEKMQ